MLCRLLEERGGVPGDRTLRITPTIGNPSLTPAAMTASTRATDTDFELGDKVGLKVTMTADGKDFVSNKPMTFDGTDFKTEGFLWYEDINATSTLFAYYPWQEGGDIPRGILGQGRSERRQLHGFGPDRGREGGRQADAVVHADDFQAQDVAHTLST